MGGVMNNEKRKGECSIPKNVEDCLNIFQKDVLDLIKNNGWSLKFVRRSASEQMTIVVENVAGQEVAVLEEDGKMNYWSGIVMRDDGKSIEEFS
jgi:hypothetical protein